MTRFSFTTNATRLRGDRDQTRSQKFSGRRRQCLARIAANALDHRAQAVGALRRQVIAEAELVEHLERIGCENFLGRMPGIQRQQDRDQAAHDMGVAVAEIVQPRLAAIAPIDLLREPDLADATLHLVFGGMLSFRQRL